MPFETRVTRSKVGTSLPLAYTLEPRDYRFVTVARLTLTDLVVGELVLVSASSQAELLTTPEPGDERVMLGRYLKATPTESNLHTEGLLLVTPMGENFTVSQHYSLQPVSSAFVVTPAEAGTMNLLFVNYAAGLSGEPDDPRSLRVKYVELRATRIREPQLQVQVFVNGVEQ